MLYSTLMLMMSSAFLMLRLTPGGSFPRPLSEAEERKYLDAWLQGDLEAIDVLNQAIEKFMNCLLYTSDAADE